MALEGLLQIRERVVATVDLSAQQYALVQFDGTLAGAGEYGFPLVDKPASGEEGTVVLVGKAKGIAAGTFAAGIPLMSDANGHLLTATATNEIVGISLESAVDNDKFLFLVSSQGIL